MRAAAFALVVLAFPAHAADAFVLSCIPDGPKGQRKNEAYLDGFANSNYPPNKFESVRVLVRFGEDVYEFFPHQTKLAEVRNGDLRLHLFQPLSAGETAEVRFEGKIGAKKGEPFLMEMHVRAGQRSGQGQVRCTIE